MSFNLVETVKQFITVTKDAILEVENDGSLTNDQKLEKATEIVIDRVIMPLVKVFDIPGVPEIAEGFVDKFVAVILKATLPALVQEVFNLMKGKFFGGEHI